MTEYELFRALRPHFPKEQYALLPQVANATGTGTNRHADALAMGLWPSRGLHLHGFEIKSHRSDWTRELKNPAKAETIAAFCHYWWVVTAKEQIVQPGELPEGWGLFTWNTEKTALVKTKQAPIKKATTIDISFLAAILRQAQEVATPDDVVQAAKKEGYEAGMKTASYNAEHDHRKLGEMRKQLDAFEKASGVTISEYTGGNELGVAVRIVMSGSEDYRRKQLLRVASEIIKELDPERVQEDIKRDQPRRRNGRR